MGVVMLLLARAGSAQPADTVVTRADALARFVDARALAVDPAGVLYVVDAGRDVLLRLLATGAVLDVLGGPGAAPGEFDEPVDIDPTNGLLLVVADYGNGRVQRFSREFRHLASLPVGERPGPAAAGGFGAVSVGADAPGRPAAVVTSTSDDTYVLDDDRRVVLKWNAGGRLERVIGGYDAGAGSLVEPVALAVDPRAGVYVADRGRRGVLVYDLFGNYVRTLGEGLARDVRGVVSYGDEVWIVLPERLLVYEAGGRLGRVLDVRLGEPLVDVAITPDAVFLLTATRLYRM